MKKRKSNNKDLDSLSGHLTELRKRILNSFLSLLPAFVVCWYFSEFILDFLRKPLQPFLKSTQGGLIFTAPTDKVVAHIQVAFFAGIFLSSPYWLSQLWCFISPGLYKKEKKMFIFFCFTGTILFFMGLCFAYFIVFPLLFSVLMNFGGGIDQPFITIKNYLYFIIRFSLVLGFVFEMPLILILLCRSGIISTEVLKKYRRQAILCLSILSAFITPPDVLTLFLLFFPLIGLYELSIWLTHLFNKGN